MEAGSEWLPRADGGGDGEESGLRGLDSHHGGLESRTGAGGGRQRSWAGWWSAHGPKSGGPITAAKEYPEGSVGWSRKIGTELWPRLGLGGEQPSASFPRSFAATVMAGGGGQRGNWRGDGGGRRAEFGGGRGALPARGGAEWQEGGGYGGGNFGAVALPYFEPTGFMDQQQAQF